MSTEPVNPPATPAWHTPGGIPRSPQRSEWLPSQADVEAFARRAGYTASYEDLESWARRMAERAAMELAIRPQPPLPVDLVAAIQAYGDARASNDGSEARNLKHALALIQTWHGGQLK